MIVTVKLWSEFNPADIAKLEIYTLNSAYELTGKGTVDGGRFEFVKVSGFVECHFHSNLRKTLVSTFRSSNWGVNSPPVNPWERTQKIEAGIYIGTTNFKHNIEWIVV
ncbi:MAG TPA: hypothetical protein PKY59_08595 [Pyrinomonadaceae bacterium]|nr:hypothetical protein [Pyrinomonadaceae bacterium]